MGIIDVILLLKSLLGNAITRDWSGYISAADLAASKQAVFDPRASVIKCVVPVQNILILGFSILSQVKCVSFE